jgi:hypothetical protein
MTNQTLRERFKLPENKSAVISQAIGATIDAGLVKPDEQVGASRKYARYLPSGRDSYFSAGLPARCRRLHCSIIFQ